MIHSMTGFGRASGTLSPRYSIAVNVKSVNHRFLDLFYVMCEPRQFLCDVGLLDHDHRFLRDAILGDVDARCRSNLLYALLVV